jgi:hypothetical protein
MNADAKTPSKKTKRKAHKRKVSRLDSCVRTDLLKLAPNTGKSVVIEEFFVAYRAASVILMDKIWEGFLKGKSDPVWKLVPVTNTLSGRSTLLQPAEASARVALASHLGWLSNDVKSRIYVFSRRLRRLVEKKPVAEQGDLHDSLNTFIHGLNAINSSKAWMKVGDERAKGIMKPAGAKSSVAAPERAYEIAARLLVRASRGTIAS